MEQQYKPGHNPGQKDDPGYDANHGRSAFSTVSVSQGGTSQPGQMPDTEETSPGRGGQGGYDADREREEIRREREDMNSERDLDDLDIDRKETGPSPNENPGKEEPTPDL